MTTIMKSLMALTYVVSFNKKLTNFSADQKPILILNKQAATSEQGLGINSLTIRDENS